MTNSNAVTARITGLGAPVLAIARTLPNNVGITWNRASGAAGYSVYRGTDPASLSWYAGTVNPWFTDTQAVNGTTYYYRITAYMTLGSQAWYSTGSATPVLVH